MNTRMRMIGLVCACGGLLLCALTARAAEPSFKEAAEALKSSDEAVRLKGIDQLGACGDQNTEAVALLSGLLKDSSSQVRAHAARSLGVIGTPAVSAVPALVDLLKDSDAVVRRRAVASLVQIRSGPQVIMPFFAKLLEDADAGVRLRILNAIAEAGANAVPGLVEALKDEKTTYWACLVLREIGPAAKDAVPALAETLKDSRPEIRREAILALASMDDGAIPVVEQIAAALSDEHTQTAATYALGRIGKIPADAEATIRANAKSDEKMLSTTSLWALARVHPEDKQLRRDATMQLVERLKDQDAFVRVAAARALAALPPAPEITGPIWEKAIRGADETTIQHALDALASLGSLAVPRLIDALAYEKTRLDVVTILGQIGPEAAPATEALAKLMEDKNSEVVYEAALALAKIGPGAKAAAPSLIALAAKNDDPNANVAVYALGRIGPGAVAAAPTLLNLLKSPDDLLLAQTSAWALTQIQPGSAEIAAKTVPILTGALSSELPIARRGAAEALGDLGPMAKNAVATLQHAASGDDDASVREAAAKALKQISGNQK